MEDANGLGQKAPSAKRCIKTDCLNRLPGSKGTVRKHRAPKGALRPSQPPSSQPIPRVRKHRAPKGALRPRFLPRYACAYLRQKAPSAIRCIKTLSSRPHGGLSGNVRKHRAPNGALRQWPPSCCFVVDMDYPASESTERQKVH